MREFIGFLIVVVVSMIDPLQIAVMIIVGGFSRRISQCLIYSIIGALVINFLIIALSSRLQSQISIEHAMAVFFGTFVGSSLIYRLTSILKNKQTDELQINK